MPSTHQDAGQDWCCEHSHHGAGSRHHDGQRLYRGNTQRQACVVVLGGGMQPACNCSHLPAATHRGVGRREAQHPCARDSPFPTHCVMLQRSDPTSWTTNSPTMSPRAMYATMLEAVPPGMQDTCGTRGRARVSGTQCTAHHACNKPRQQQGLQLGLILPEPLQLPGLPAAPRSG